MKNSDHKEGLSLLDLVFYHIYKSLVRSDGEKSSRLLALFIISGLICLNLMALVLLFKLMGFYHLFVWLETNKEYKFVGMYILIAFFLYRMYYPERHQIVIKESSKREERLKKMGARLVFTYGFFSFVLVFVLASL